MKSGTKVSQAVRIKSGNITSSSGQRAAIEILRRRSTKGSKLPRNKINKQQFIDRLEKIQADLNWLMLHVHDF